MPRKLQRSLLPHPILEAELDRRIDAILLGHLPEHDDSIAPSAGLADSVMHAIRHPQSTQPTPRFAPLEFPWKRVLPGAIIAALCILLMLVAAWHTSDLQDPWQLLALGSPHNWPPLVWLCIGILFSAGALLLPWQLTRNE